MLPRSDAIPNILIITGLMASGKSSAAQAVAERLPNSVHLRGDIFRKMIINGRAEVTPEAGPDALKQLTVRYRLAWDACAAYVVAGFCVIYQDVILGRHLADACAALQKYKVGVVVLRPSLRIVADRDRNRSKKAYGDNWTPSQLDATLQLTPDIGLWIDTSNLTVDETVDAIFTRAHETRRNV